MSYFEHTIRKMVGFTLIILACLMPWGCQEYEQAYPFLGNGSEPGPPSGFEMTVLLAIAITMITGAVVLFGGPKDGTDE